MPSNTQSIENYVENNNNNATRNRTTPFNGQQISKYLTSSWTEILAAVSDGQRPNSDKPIIYKPKVVAQAWGTKESSIKSSPWGVKKGAKTANGLDLLSELKKPIVPKTPSPQPAPTTPSKKTLTTTTKKNH